ncbi:spore coat protein [Dictyostelium discoideum AX4]|uniref:Prespore protein Dd31 n=1 Tax=Dictyostelium discoideum TaxID=44689 RepID=DD31_DICDI|nr:spore coat protein [Dictyostelium discoideum AX4]Q02465.1 RecName: Full=Prespore protein Dd31 [Dictyostelium discoideum]EAL62887.1 spore coat protein [Dictyostelium discoideum AX4]CAA38320.1 spiA protein [Dictyostelium discoideum]|eukprot:XP_636403.1 spore coat protein [Dictyostelium discoideum AX4]
MEHNNNPGTPQMSSEFPASTTQTSSSAAAYDNSSHFEKEQSLMRWEQDLKLRERALANNQSAADITGPHVVVPAPATAHPRQANFPSSYPMIRLNLEEDIAIREYRQIVKFGIFVFLWEAAALVYNWVVSIGTIVYSAVDNFFLALFYMIVGVPTLYFLTRKLYRAASVPERARKSYAYLMALLGVVLFNIIFFVGFKRSGMNGLIWVISLFHNDHNAVGAMATVSLFFWFVGVFLTIALFIMYLRLNNTKRQRGEIQNAGFREYIKSR